MLQSIDTLIAFVTLMTICSLFVLITVQMISAALSLRGKNLCNALAVTFQTVAPELNEKAHQLAWRILCDPVLSDSVHAPKDHSPSSGKGGPLNVIPVLGWLSGVVPVVFKGMTLANAIRPEEVFNALRKIAASDSDEAMQAAAKTLLGAVKAPSEVDAKLAALSSIVSTINNPQLNEASDKLAQEIKQLAQQAVTTVDAVEAEVKTWLDSAQNRAQQWFQTHTRGFTIAVSIVMAFACQWDAVEIYNQVSTNPATRDALVRASAEVVKNGDLINDPQGGLVNRIATAWNANHAADAQKLTATASNTGVLRQAVQAMNSPELLADFDQLVTDQKNAFMAEKQKDIDYLSSLTQQAGYQLLPTAGKWRWGDKWWDMHPKNVFGMALFAALLTLGAPYWFNMLAKLANLRPAIAQLMGENKSTSSPSGAS